jgi:hypothetical protein
MKNEKYSYTLQKTYYKKTYKIWSVNSTMFKFRATAAISAGTVASAVACSLDAPRGGSPDVRDGPHSSIAYERDQQRIRWPLSIVSNCDASSPRLDGSSFVRSEGLDATLERLLFPRHEDFWSQGHDKNLLLRYDPSTRNPKWVLEHITSRGRHTAVTESRKSMHFHTDSVVAAAVEAGAAPPASMASD